MKELLCFYDDNYVYKGWPCFVERLRQKCSIMGGCYWYVRVKIQSSEGGWIVEVRVYSLEYGLQIVTIG